MAQDHWRGIKNAPQRLVLCRLMLDVHSAYAPAGERFGTRLETFFIALYVALGDIEGKPLSLRFAPKYCAAGTRAGTAPPPYPP